MPRAKTTKPAEDQADKAPDPAEDQAADKPGKVAIAHPSGRVMETSRASFELVYRAQGWTEV